MPRAADPAKVVRLDLSEPLAPIEVDARYSRLLLVVVCAGKVIGHVDIPATPVVTEEAQRSAIRERLDGRLSEELVRRAFLRAARGATESDEESGPSVSVVVEPGPSADGLRACLESLDSGAARAKEVFVLDDARRGELESICAEHSARYLWESSGLPPRLRAIQESSGELIAFTSGDCVVDPAWLSGLGTGFADPLVMATTGYVGPLELETPTQCLLDAQDERLFERTVFHGASTARTLPTVSPVRAADRLASRGNVVFRRRLFEETGLERDAGVARAPAPTFELYSLYRLLGTGYRIVFDPAQIAWRRLTRDPAGARRAAYESSAAVSLYASLCLLRHGEPGAARLWLSRLVGHVRALIGGRRGLPPGLALAEGRGTLGAVWRAPRFGRVPRAESAPGSPDREYERADDEWVELAVVEPADPPLSVVIPSFNRRDKVGEVLRLLARQTFPADRFEVVVVLDGSTDGSAEFVRSLTLPYALKLIEQPNSGLAATRNRGTRAASHPLVVYLDDDLYPEPQFLAEHAAAHRQGDERLVVIGYCPPALSGERLSERLERTFWEDHYARKAEPDHQWTYIDFSAGNASLPRSLLESAGWFDEHFGPRNEEQELGVRLVRQGARFAYRPRAVAHHHFDASFRAHLHRTRAQAVYDVALVRKYPHLRGRVTIGRYTRGKGMAARSLIAYRYPRTAELVVRGTLPLADVLDTLRARRGWRRLTAGLAAVEYVLGLRDALRTQEALRELVTSIWEEAPTVALPVWLDRPNSLELPPEGHAAALRIGYRGAPLVDLLAQEPGREWSWEELTDRLVSEHAEAVAGAVPLPDLFRLAGVPDGLSMSPLTSSAARS